MMIEGMKMEPFKIIFYQNEDGTKPVADFLRSLDIDMRAKIASEIAMLKQFGNLLREPHSKPIEDGIFELRAKFGSDISRVLYFFFARRRVVLTNGFVKKTQKTPKAEIELAKQYRKDFLRQVAEDV